MMIGDVRFLVFIGLFIVGCQQAPSKHTAPKARKVSSSGLIKATDRKDPQWLSSYGFFKGDMAALSPETNVYSYAVNTPLFSNYAKKERFVYLPEGKKINFKATGPLHFDSGAILIKNFLYPHDETDPESGYRLIETRLLINEDGTWKPLNYTWNEAQTDAELNYVGKTEKVQWKNHQGRLKKVNYVVPNINQCKNCHSVDNVISPIGVTAAQLNQRYRAVKEDINQLDYFKKQGFLTQFTSASDYDPMPVWNNVLTGSVENRAKAYLDANCAHCHSAQGSAKNSGLYLDYHQQDNRARGVFKPPIAAGKGSGDFQYDIVPGKPEESIFIYRVGSVDPAIRMPELGRSLVHEEGLALLTQYIKELRVDDASGSE